MNSKLFLIVAFLGIFWVSNAHADWNYVKFTKSSSYILWDDIDLFDYCGTRCYEHKTTGLNSVSDVHEIRVSFSKSHTSPSNITLINDWYWYENDNSGGGEYWEDYGIDYRNATSWFNTINYVAYENDIDYLIYENAVWKIYYRTFTQTGDGQSVTYYYTNNLYLD